LFLFAVIAAVPVGAGACTDCQAGPCYQAACDCCRAIEYTCACLKCTPRGCWPMHRCATPCFPCPACTCLPDACHKPVTTCYPCGCVCLPCDCHKPAAACFPEDPCPVDPVLTGCRGWICECE
jgi:hypothetical protein